MNKILSLLGLAQRARYIVLGEEFVLKAMASNPAGIVFLASDAGANIRKKIKDKSETYEYTVVEEFDSDQLSNAIGKSNRKLLLIHDQGFVKSFKKYLSS